MRGLDSSRTAARPRYRISRSAVYGARWAARSLVAAPAAPLGRSKRRVLRDLQLDIAASYRCTLHIYMIT